MLQVRFLGPGVRVLSVEGTMMDSGGRQPPGPGRFPGYHTHFRSATREDLNEFLRQLLNTEWDTPDSPLCLRGDLGLGQVAETRFFNQVRVFLRLLAEERKGMLLTAAGNFRLATVARMCERMEWPRQRAGILRRIGARRMTEQDISPLHLIRVVCDCGRLVRRRHNRLFAVKRALSLLEDDRAGQLYRRLFLAFFREFNLDYMHGGPEVPLVQQSMAVVFWRLSIVANEWIPADRLPDELLLESVRRQVVEASSLPDAADCVLVSHVLRPLQWFGLLEGDPPLDHRRSVFDPDPVRYRKTPLFDRFISFVPRSLRPEPAPDPDWA